MIVMVSCLADNHLFLYEAMARHLSATLKVPVELDSRPPWQERQRMLFEGQAQLGMLCGLSYVVQRRWPNPPLHLVAAPVMAAPRYQGRPVYFSDVLVRRESAYHSFADLKGARFAYNEPYSHSGYAVVRYHLFRSGYTQGFFGQARESGSHRSSLDWLLGGLADGVALDSTFLDLEMNPALEAQVRVVEVLGPSPIQPLLAHSSVSPALRQEMSEALRLFPCEGLPVAEIVTPTEADYDPLEAMVEAARQAPLTSEASALAWP